MPTDETKSPTSKLEASARYDDPEQARIAVKLLTNQGYHSEQLFVLCSDEKRSEAFRSRLMPAGASQLNTAPTVVGAAGSAIGAGLLGTAGLAAGGVGAVAGAALGAVAGGGVGLLLGAGTASDDETKLLAEQNAKALEQGMIVVHVKLSDGSSSEEHTRVEELLTTARKGVV